MAAVPVGNPRKSTPGACYSLHTRRPLRARGKPTWHRDLQIPFVPAFLSKVLFRSRWSIRRICCYWFRVQNTLDNSKLWLCLNERSVDQATHTGPRALVFYLAYRIYGARERTRETNVEIMTAKFRLGERYNR